MISPELLEHTCIMSNMTKTVLFIPMNSRGHIIPLVAIANGLKDSYGYHTIFLLDDSDYSSNITANKHDLVVLKNDKIEIDEKVEVEIETDAEVQNVSQLDDYIMSLKEEFKLDVIEQYVKFTKESTEYYAKSLCQKRDSFLEEINSIKPDLLVSDFIYLVPGFEKSLHGKPWVLFFPPNPIGQLEFKLPGLRKIPPFLGVSLMKSKAEREKLRNEQPDEWNAFIQRLISIRRRIDPAQRCDLLDKLFADHGEEPFEFYHGKHDSPYLNIGMFPAEIDYDKEDDLCEYRPRWLMFDCFLEKGQAETDLDEVQVWTDKLSEAKEGRTEMIYFSLGTIASGDIELVQRYVDIFSEDTKRLYVISKGPHGDKINLNGKNLIGANYLPQRLILEFADLAIVHAGNNSFVECLYNGVPMITLPVFNDQYDNAQRVEDLELGRRLDAHNCSKEELNQAINDVLSDESIRKRVQEISAKMKTRNDLQKVIAILRKLTEEGQLDDSFFERCKARNYDWIKS